MSRLWPGRGGPAIDYITAAPPANFCSKFPRSTVILGSTGSIGRNALGIIESNPGLFTVNALAAGRNVDLLAAQAMRHRPPLLAVLDEAHARRLRQNLAPDYQPRILWGGPGYAQLASSQDADCVVSAQVGEAGLAATLSAALAGKVICLANKESLVLAGGLVRRICADSGATILPVDSEHHAIFQCLAGRGQEANRLILTASGGPFIGKGASEIRHMRAGAALKHPNWNMGAKISIDSATLMNKGLEALEAMHLYGVPLEQIEILVHPQSIVHSLVQLADNSQLAQLAVPDMRLPIANCLLWPLVQTPAVRPLNLAKTGPLTFQEPDRDTFFCLELALGAGRYMPEKTWRELGINPACVILNAANEAAIELFLADKCHFGHIGELVRSALDNFMENIETGTFSIPKMEEGGWEGALALAASIGEMGATGRRYVHSALENIVI